MRSKKSASQKLTVVLLAVILVLCCTIGGTLAWLSAQTDALTNTFTVGDINITLEETKGNAYKILPGGEAEKDPVITVVKESEKCYVYALVENTVKLDGVVVATPDIDADEWHEVVTKGDKTLYRYIGEKAVDSVVDASADAVECQVFTKVSYSNTIEKSHIETLSNTKIIIDAYAHQSENTTMNDADNAAKAHFGLN